MSRFSADQYAELAVPGAKFSVLVEIDLPSGTVERLAPKGQPAGHAGVGSYHERLLSLSPFSPVIDDRRCSLQSPEITAKVDNSDMWWSKLAATYGNSLFNSTVRVKVASRGCASSSWLAHYTGRLIGWPGDGSTVTLKFRPLDAQLLSKLRLKRVTRDLFSSAPLASIEREIPLCYGLLSDRGAPTMQGIVTGIQIDDGYNFLLCYGWASSVLDIFSNGTRLTSGQASATYTEYGGHKYTLATSVAQRDGATITANLKGYESVGDRSGTFISHPLAQARHCLANFFFSEPSGLWVDDSTLAIDGTSCDAAIASLASRAGGTDYVGGRWITTAVRGVDLLNEACLSVLVPPVWTPEGKVGFAYDNLHYGDYPTTIFRDYDIDSLRSIDDGANVVALVAASWAADGTVPGSIEVQNLQATESGASESIDLTWAGLTDR